MQTKQVITTKKGDSSVMQVQTVDLASPSENEVQIKIIATGIAWADVMIRRGLYPNMPKFPVVQGYEFTGEVIAIGDNIDQMWLGKKVAAIIQWGAYSQYINIGVNELMELPNEVDMQMAAFLPLNYATAYQMLVRKAKVKEGDVILIHGASGGVGSAALQIAKQLKLKVYATASIEKLHAITAENGIAIDYKNQDFEQVIREKEPNGIDAYFDVGGRKTFDKSYKLLKKGGTGITFGFLEIKKISHFIGLFAKLAFRNKFSNKHISMFSIMKGKKKLNKDYHFDFNALVCMLQENKINPLIAKVVGLDEIAKAHNEFENHTFVGKIGINPHK